MGKDSKVEDEIQKTDNEKSESETEVTKYVCDICGKEFEKESSLIAHKIRAHAPKKGGVGGTQEIELPEEEDHISILEDLLSKYKSKTLTEDVKEYILDLARNTPGGLKPKELYAELLDWGVQEKTAKKIAKLYKIRLDRLMSKKSDELEDDFEDDFEDKEEEIVVKKIDLPKPKKKKKKYVIIVDGASIETDDPQEYLAWKRYLDERREYELRMKKLEEEIKAIAKSQEPKEDMVEIPIGDVKIKVPQSIAMWFLFMNRTDKDKELVEVEIDGKKVKVPPEVAVLYDIEKKKIEKKEEIREKREVEDLRSQVRSLQINISKLLEEIKKRDELIEKILKGELNLGSGKTVIDLIDARAKELNETARMIIQRLPSTQSNEIKYVAKRTPEEREQIAHNIMKKLEKSEELINVENEILDLGG